VKNDLLEPSSSSPSASSGHVNGFDGYTDDDIVTSAMIPAYTENCRWRSQPIRSYPRRTNVKKLLEAAKAPVMRETTSRSLPRKRLLMWKDVICSPLPPNPRHASPKNLRPRLPSPRMYAIL
jgi:hypothetical protein